MGVGQDQVSRVERRADVKLSTLIEYLHGMDATDIELAVVFRDGRHSTLPLAK